MGIVTFCFMLFFLCTCLISPLGQSSSLSSWGFFVLVILFCFCFGGGSFWDARDSIHGLTHGRQVLYHWAISLALFLLCILAKSRVLLAFHHSYVIQREVTYKEEVYFTPVWRFLSMIHWPPCFGPVIRQYIMVGACGRAKLLLSWTFEQRGRD